MIKKVTEKYDVGKGFINVNDITDSMNVFIQDGTVLQKCAVVDIGDVRLLDMNTHTVTPDWTKEPSVKAMAKWGLGNPSYKSVYVIESAKDLEDLKAGRNLPVEKKSIQFSDLREGMYVLLRSDLEHKSYDGIPFVSGMDKYKGKLLQIKSLYSSYEPKFTVVNGGQDEGRNCGQGWHFTAPMISKIVEIKPGKQFTLANNDYYDSWDYTFEKGDVVTIKDVQKRFYDDITLFEVYTTDRDETRMVKLEDLLPITEITVGDEVEVLTSGRTSMYHSFDRGEIVTIIQTDDSRIPYRGQNANGLRGWFQPHDIKLAA